MGEVRIGMGSRRNSVVQSVPLACYRGRSITTEAREEFGGLRGLGFGFGGRQAIWPQGRLAAAAVDAEEVPQLGRGRSVRARRI